MKSLSLVLILASFAPAFGDEPLRANWFFRSPGIRFQVVAPALGPFRETTDLESGKNAHVSEYFQNGKHTNSYFPRKQEPNCSIQVFHPKGVTPIFPSGMTPLSSLRIFHEESRVFEGRFRNYHQVTMWFSAGRHWASLVCRVYSAWPRPLTLDDVKEAFAGFLTFERY